LYSNADVVIDSAAVADQKEDAAKNIPPSLPEQKFLRTATLKFEVNNVEQASDYIEKKTRQMGGYVGNSSVNSSLLNDDLISVSPDSLIKSTRYSLSGNLMLRIPDNRLDSLLGEIQSLSIFLDSRIVTADDVSLKILENQLNRQRARTSNQRLSHYSERSKNRLRDLQSTDNTIDERTGISDEALLNNLLLQQQVQYSTVTVSISQEPVVLTKLIAKEKIIPPYREPFFKRLAASFSGSFSDLEEIAVGIFRFWILLVIILISGLYFKKHLQTVKKAN
jgi:cell division protein FtsB